MWTVQVAELSSNCNWGITYGNKAYKYGAHIRINSPTLHHLLLQLGNWFSFLVLFRFTFNLCFPTGGMEAKGTRITLRITDPLDLNRDVLKVHIRLSQLFWEDKIMPRLDFRLPLISFPHSSLRRYFREELRPLFSTAAANRALSMSWSLSVYTSDLLPIPAWRKYKGPTFAWHFFFHFLQSETCEVILPSLDFTCTAGTLGGRFTTLEGLLSNIKDHVRKCFWFLFLEKFV